jgi:TRAP-type uncharacterized transport system substrate-binding protein
MRLLTVAFAAILSLGLFSASAPAQTPPPSPFRLCTGGEAGNYFKAGHILKSKSGAPIVVISTQGSLDNLAKVTAGECDGAFVQADALMVYSSKNAQALSSIERAGVLYEEHAHLLCNRQSGVSRITDLTSKHTVAVGPDGSGARTTWDAFVIADKKRYAPVSVDTRSGVRALSAVADGSQVQCALWVGALNASFIKDDAQKHGDRLALVGTDDWDMGGVAKDSRGVAVYGYGEVPADTYPRVQPGGTLYGTKPVKTIKMDALFVANVNWINANERAYDGLLRSFAAAKPGIQAIVNPAK